MSFCKTWWNAIELFGKFWQYYQFILPSSHPQENVSIILQTGYVQASHFIVRHGSIRKFHVYVPRWICHDHRELAEDGHVKHANITVDPLTGIGVKEVEYLKSKQCVRCRNQCYLITTSTGALNMNARHLFWNANNFGQIMVDVERCVSFAKKSPSAKFG